MKKTLSTILALVMALSLVFGCIGFAAAEAELPPEGGPRPISC